MRLNPYNDAYFDKYIEYKEYDIGRRINDSRVLLVSSFVDNFTSFVDVGIGSGQFVESVGCLGFDVNPKAVEWLKSIGKLHTEPTCDYKSFWDSLEHIDTPAQVLEGAKKGVFISMPIYKDLDHVLSSKHFRPSEHCWYFTHDGLVKFMADYGFYLVAHSDNETKAGREDIRTVLL